MLQEDAKQGQIIQMIFEMKSSMIERDLREVDLIFSKYYSLRSREYRYIVNAENFTIIFSPF